LAVGSWQLAVGSWQLATDLAAKMQPQLQKLFGGSRPLRAIEIFSQEGQKGRRRRMWGLALPPVVWCCVARRMARRAIKPSELLPFL
jgi:hypothetical protein